MKRTFIAFDIQPTAETKTACEKIQQKLNREKIHWIPTDNFHLTLKFLGNTEEKVLPSIVLSLTNALLEYKPFEVLLHGIGIFRNLRDPRIIWMGCEGGQILNDIKQRIELAMAGVGFEPDNHGFNPHLTIGRIKQIKNTEILADVVSGYKQIEFQKQKIEKIILYESNLLPAGAKYTPLQIFRLK